jgi:hypothetical protein
MPSGSRRSWLLFSIILILSVILRVSALDADPPRPMSGGPSPNEGLYVLNARNKVVDGQWKMDDWNISVLNPLGASASAAAFRASGIRLRSARLLSVVLSTLALILFFVLLKDASGAVTALLGALFLGTNAVFLIYSRQAGPAPLGILLMLTTILLWRGTARFPLLAPVAGVSLALSAIVENGSHNMFFLATAVIATLLIRLQAWKMPWAAATGARIRRFWWAAILTVVTWALGFVLPNSGEFFRMSNTPLSSFAWGNMAQNLFMAPFNFGRLVQWTPVTSVVALLYLLIFARTLMAPIARHRPLSETRVWFFAWLVTAPLFMALRSERPLNVLVLIVPPICVAAAEALTLLLSTREIRKPRLDILVVLGLLTLTTWITVQTIVHGSILLGYRWIPRAFFHHQFRYEFALVVVLAAPIAFFLAHLWLKWKKFTFEMSPRVVSVVFTLFLCGILLTNAVAAVLILRTGSDVRDASQVLSELPRGSVVAGTWAPLLCLDTGNRSLVIWPTMNNEPDALERRGVTHLLLQRGSREALETNPAFAGRGVDETRSVRRLRQIRLGQVDLDLYELTAKSRTPN